MKKKKFYQKKQEKRKFSSGTLVTGINTILEKKSQAKTKARNKTLTKFLARTVI